MCLCPRESSTASRLFLQAVGFDGGDDALGAAAYALAVDHDRGGAADAHGLGFALAGVYLRQVIGTVEAGFELRCVQAGFFG